MATREITKAPASRRTRPGAIVLALVLAAITMSLALSLIETRSSLTRLHREADRLHTELNDSRSAASALELRRLIAAHAFTEGPFERVRAQVAAKTAEFATPRRIGSGP